MAKIEYAGLKEINEKEKEILDKLSEEYYPKIKRKLHNELTLKIHIKKYSETGEKHKWSIHAKAIAPTKIFTSDKACDWDFARTLHKAFKDLENEISKKMKE